MKLTKMLPALVTGLALTASSALAGEDLDRIMENGVMKVSTSLNWAPQSFLNEDNEMDGFDVSVAREIGKRMGVEVEFVTPDWSIITAGNWNDRWDVSIGSMTPTPQRAEVLDFPVIYYYTPGAFMVHEDSEAVSLSDLNGKKIGTVINSTYESYLRKELVIDALGAPEFEFQVTPGEIVSMDTIGAVLDDLRLGDGIRLDAGITSLPGIISAQEAGYPIKALEERPFYGPAAVAIDKGDPELAAKLTEIVEEMRADGTLNALSMKWYGVDLSVAN
jgi:polar amino acid transport system substrate-binding protein